MDKTLIDYDKNLEELERQRENLKVVMQRMGQEWEESGAGIGWLGSLDIPTDNSNIKQQQQPQPQLLPNVLQPTTGPSPEYLQSLLHMNEALLAQSLANNPTPMLSPSKEEETLTDISSPLITPNDNEQQKIP
ncbi:hypothetical protein G6F57_013625 [Rhizopus arrhizus]|uniref:Uncharacterized protein n=1 Tax=Rhizopus oryzae TaxID=64495 RepID=A0A9P7BLL7_RHIOR|nr:hypothetical protein G6F23_012010 [Rhizopus arrhizus]KAG1391626.1 hypothetical protein G6F58_012676 [Rhizopus delemar]KAG0754122.1 hypothetical protein G6F24_012610 [Rhizopus arrhizus]KAG0770904.1 hypothetical protein G6F22_016975 [Rhizopus arrhizus]KAG0781135.1 hypothetical protein G6F21_011800 [Rhizopus arrhizus]